LKKFWRKSDLLKVVLRDLAVVVLRDLAVVVLNTSMERFRYRVEATHCGLRRIARRRVLLAVVMQWRTVLNHVEFSAGGRENVAHVFLLLSEVQSSKIS